MALTQRALAPGWVAILGAVLAVHASAQDPEGELLRGRIEIDPSAPADGDVGGFARFLVIDGVRHPVRGPLGFLLELSALSERDQEVRLRGERLATTIVPSAVQALVFVDEARERQLSQELGGPADPSYVYWIDLSAAPEAEGPSPGRVFAGDRVDVVELRRIESRPPSRWARVRTPDGRAGWLNPTALRLTGLTRVRARVVDAPDGPRLEVDGGLQATGRAAEDLLRLGARSVILEGCRVGPKGLHVVRALLRSDQAVSLRDPRGHTVAAGEVLALLFVSGGRASVIHLDRGGAPATRGAFGPVAAAELSSRGPTTSGLVDKIPR